MMRAVGPRSDCPDAEALAALAEGTVTGEERKALLRHLRSCQECYLAYETALISVGEGQGRAFFSRRAALFGWAAMAAAATVAAVSVGVHLLSPQVTPPRAEALLPTWSSARAFAGRAGAPVDLPPATAWRRSAPGHALVPDEPLRLARRLGVRFAELDWAVRFQPGSAEAALEALRGELIDAGKGDLAQGLVSMKAHDARGVEAIATTVLPTPDQRDAAALAWTFEWSRLAAHARRPELLPRLHESRWRATAATMADPVARDLLEQIVTSLRGAPPSHTDLPRLEERLSQILEVLT